MVVETEVVKVLACEASYERVQVPSVTLRASALFGEYASGTTQAVCKTVASASWVRIPPRQLLLTEHVPLPWIGLRCAYHGNGVSVRIGQGL